MIKARTIVVSLLLIGVLLPVALLAQSRAGGTLGGGTSAVKSPYNPKPFQKFAVSPSGPVRFLFSERGMQIARTSRNSGARAILKVMGETPNPSGSNRSFQPPTTGRAFPMAATVNTACGTANGAVFNKEPAADALPQNEESVEFFPGGAGTGVDLIIQGYNDYRGVLGAFVGMTGYSVHRSGADCSTQFDGALPGVADPFSSFDTLEVEATRSSQLTPGPMRISEQVMSILLTCDMTLRLPGSACLRRRKLTC